MRVVGGAGRHVSLDSLELRQFAGRLAPKPSSQAPWSRASGARKLLSWFHNVPFFVRSTTQPRPASSSRGHWVYADKAGLPNSGDPFTQAHCCEYAPG
jgi:hypothetical protein